jgi:transposase InsO family protein
MRSIAAATGRHGSPPTCASRAGGVSENTVAAIMRELGLLGRPTRRRRGLTRPGRGRWRAPDLIGRRFAAAGINQTWFGDGTEIRTDEGKLFLDSVLDMASRRIVGFALGEHHDTGLAYAALAMAVAVRGGKETVGGVILHTDQGGEYAARTFRAACDRIGVKQSMGRPGSALDNAVIQAWHSTLVRRVHPAGQPGGEGCGLTEAGDPQLEAGTRGRRFYLRLRAGEVGRIANRRGDEDGELHQTRTSGLLVGLCAGQLTVATLAGVLVALGAMPVRRSRVGGCHFALEQSTGLLPVEHPVSDRDPAREAPRGEQTQQDRVRDALPRSLQERPGDRGRAVVVVLARQLLGSDGSGVGPRQIGGVPLD